MKNEIKKSALEFVEWAAINISRLQYEFEELKIPFHDSTAYKKLTDAMYNGKIASYRKEFEA